MWPRFLVAFDSDLKRFAQFPNIGGIRKFTDPRLENIRSWPISGFENYLIFYRASEEDVQILRVIHGARDMERAFSE